METFTVDIAGLSEATLPEVIELADGDEVTLATGPVVKRLGEDTVRMLGYNGSIPGPTLKVQQGTEVVVHVSNATELDTTVHWHGLRLENRFDGVPHETQAPIPVGGSFTYRIQFPDPGLYWYHPHIREDYMQELGLYGNILVVPSEPDYWPPAHRDVVLTLDDVLLADGVIGPFSRTETTHAAMGRYGNLLLIGGQTDAELRVRRGEVIRLWLTNTANSRVFKVSLPGAQLKLVGGDSGRMEREELVLDVVLAPSERAVVDVLFDEPGQLALEHRTPQRTYRLASITVTEDAAEPALQHTFDQLRTAPELRAERDGLDAWLAAAPDKVLALVAELDDPSSPQAGPVTYVCPMHPDVIRDEPGSCQSCGMRLLISAAAVSYTCPMHADVVLAQPGRCPSCGMKLLVAVAAVSYACPMHPDVVRDEPGRCPSCGMKLLAAGSSADASAAMAPASHSPEHADGDGVEWEDEMAEVNRQTTTANTRWRLLDRTSGKDITPEWTFTEGERVKIRLVNEMESDHPMHHPFHLHGAGRFLVLTREGAPETNLVWKDTVLVRTGQTVDILFDVSNPGLWMAHCHIAEHMASGMMFSFTVARASAP